MDKSMLAEINRLRQMTVGDLRAEWERLYGEPTRSRNRDFLRRRLAWRVQELAHGGLSDRARQRLGELAPDSFVRALVPRGFQPPEMETAPPPAKPKTARDPRLPSPGTVYRRSRDLFLAQRFARHVSPLTTTVYTHPSDEEMRERVRTLAC